MWGQPAPLPMRSCGPIDTRGPASYLGRALRNGWQNISLTAILLAVIGGLWTGVARGDANTIQVGWLSQAAKRVLPLSYLDQPPPDEGVQGARLGIADDNS